MRHLELMEQRLSQRFRDAEMALLTAFHGRASEGNARFRKIEADHSNLDAATSARLAAIEERVLNLERRLPPSAAAQTLGSPPQR
ncbi:MAG: hypothetical protein HY822_09370 [Acidobacteria bacterium]|nr:hypothetical protein [Acidobacteriota bacterium]